MPYSPPPPRIRKWTRSDVETVARFRVFSIEKATMTSPTGVVIDRPFFTFVCPDWCNVIAITDEDELVLIWQYRHGTDAMSLEIPGGVIDGAESPLDAAKRELREETGYEATSYEPLLTVQPNPALQGNVCHTYVARGARLVGATSFDDGEECEVILVPRRHVAELLDGGHVQHALVVSALERFLRVTR